MSHEHDEPGCEGCGRDKGHEDWCDFFGLDEPTRPVKMLVATDANSDLIDALHAAEDARDLARAERDAISEQLDLAIRERDAARDRAIEDVRVAIANLTSYEHVAGASHVLYVSDVRSVIDALKEARR